MFEKYSKPKNEEERIEALKSYEILDTPNEKEFDNLLELASLLLDVPMASITFVDTERQWFKSKIGLDVDETTRKDSFCQYTIQLDSSEVLIVEDATLNVLLKDSALVTGKPHIKFYAGVPLVNQDGFSLGTLCVLDNKPHQINEKQKKGLKLIADQILNLLEIRRENLRLYNNSQESLFAFKIKNEFINKLSEEIKTPLNSIFGLADLLISENPREDQYSYLKSLKDSAQQLLSTIITNDLLDISDIKEGSIIFEQIDFNVIELVSLVKNSFSKKATQKNLIYKVRYDDDIPNYITGDPLRLSQVLSILVSNAIKNTRKGKVIVSLETKTICNEETEIEFKIEDTGTGINREIVDYIYDAKIQASIDLNRKVEGSGIGLFVAKKILKLQNSELILETEIEKGSIFSFRLKFGIPHKTDVLRKLYKVVDDNKNLNYINKRILLVEDDEINTIIIKKILEKNSLTVDIVNNGQSAIEKARNFKYDLILMDINMPILNGYDATNAIRGFDKQVPILALTATTLFGIKDKAMNMGMNDILYKPLNSKELLEKLEYYFNNSKYSS
jgi:signal transduction histidine kinase/ActR/RegA family two-component response regulator